jgi:formylglycine-generating enzyme required for sulfatase activity/CRP-like cAMP-binding protein/chromosome segregation ATPase
MDAAKKLAGKHNLQDLVPLNALSDARFAEISQKIVVEEIKKGRYLFRKGDRDNQSIYLLDGKVNLIDGHRKVTGEVEAGTDISRYPIANQQPRTLSARAVTKVVIVRIDSGLLDVFLTWDQTSSTEATEINTEDNEDWMTQMLQSEAFIKIPPAMIQRLLIKMQSYPAHKGDVVIRQGDDGDFFYTIHKGRCIVTRTSADGGEEQLAELSSGDCFGEESLVSDAKRNATVTMATDGLLMRLAKKDFVELLQKPLVRHVGHEEAVHMIDEGAVWLDVRSEGEYENGAFEDSVNIPLSELRGEMPELVYNAKYILCCDTGRRSASAGFILSHKGFEVYVLDGGMNALSPEAAQNDGRMPESGEADGEPPVMEAEVIELGLQDDAGTDATDDPGLPVDAAPADIDGLDTLHSEMAGLEQQLAASEAAVNDLQQEVQQLKDQEDLLHEQYVALQKEYDERQQQLVHELQQAQEAVTSLQAQVDSVDLEKQREHNLFERSQEDWKQRVSSLEEQLAELASQHETVLAERDADRDRLARLQEAATGAEQEQQEVVVRLQAELESTGQEQARLLGELEAEKQHASGLQQSLDDLRLKLEALDSEKQAAEDSAGRRVNEQQETIGHLQAELEALAQHQEQVDGELESERQRGADLQQQLDTQLAGHEAETAAQQEHRHQLQGALDAVESEKRDLLARLETLQSSSTEEREQLQEQSEQTELARREITELQQALEALRAEHRALEISRDEQHEQIENGAAAMRAADEALQHQQQENEDARARLQGEIEALNKTLAEQQMQLEKAYENATREQGRLEAEFSASNDRLLGQIERLETRHAEMKQERTQLQEDLQRAGQENDELRQKLESEQQQAGGLCEEVELLNGRLSALTAETEAEIAARDSRYEEERRLSETHARQLEEITAEREELRASLEQERQAAETLRAEFESQAQQFEALQQELQGTREQARKVELESEESLRKVWEDLNRKNDTEKELQGQVNRLRKKLEQSADDLQQARSEARESAAQAKQLLDTERRERAEERAQMAARQRELKEQLVTIAGEHEQLQTNQKGALAQAENAARSDERARLREVLETHAQAENELATMRRELAQAREEAERALMEERNRNAADLHFAQSQKSELDAVVAEQEARLQALTGERDSAVAEQQAMREQLNSLRAEVEIARGVINANGSGEVEDPVRLRAELEEARRNLDIAMRVRSEAESARENAIAERDALQQQLHGVAAVATGPLEIPSLDEQKELAPAGRGAAPAAAARPGNTGDSRERSTAATEVKFRRRFPLALVGKLAGFAAVAGALLASWFMLGSPEPDRGDKAEVAVELVEPVREKEVAIPPVEDQASASARTPVARKPETRVEAAVASRAETGKKDRPGEAAPATVSRQRPEPAAVAAVTPGRSFSDALKNGGRGPAMVELPSASYRMGSRGSSPHFEERPRHTVELPAFAVSKHEVTFEEYDRFARATGRRLPYDEGWGRGERPVINVSWKDASAYAEWLSRQTGHTYRLPTEAQWEFVARAGSTTPHWWPESSNEIPANCFDCGSRWGGKMPAPVGSFQANGFGLHDTAGNVQEWTQDCYYSSYKGAPSDGSARQSAGCSQRVVRGGAYSSPLDSLRSAKRAQFDQDTRLDNLGFRVVRLK